jgi:outer membrane protein assembly factor BamB
MATSGMMRTNRADSGRPATGNWRSRLRVTAAATAAALLAGLCAVAAPTTAGATEHAAVPSGTMTGWNAYLNGPTHSSYNAAERAITPATVNLLVRKWHAGGHLYLASPTVDDGAVFIGTDGGWFFKFDATTGRLLHRVFIGFQPHKTCGAFGTVATATVAPDPVTHQLTVYVAGANGYLYALSATSLQVEWKSVIAIPSTKVSNYMDWSSPTVVNGKIYIGVASNCDQPLIRGQLIAYDQASGRKIAHFFTVPGGDIGGSIWSSIAVAPDGDVFATTGNGPEDDQLLGYSESILKLSPTLRLLDRFRIPAGQVEADSDFGGSPVLFGRYVGACNKNGILYAVRQSTMRLAWEQRVSAPAGPVTGCVVAPAYDGHHLYMAGLGVTIHGRHYRGSIQERNPANGRLLWETGLPNGVIGSPTLDGGGVLAVGTYDYSSTPNATYLIDAKNGKILRRLVTGTDFAQSAWADDWLFTANSSGLYAWGLKTSSS